MAYPLVPSTVTAAAEFIPDRSQSYEAVPLVVDLDATHTTRWAGLLFRNVRTVALEFIDRQFAMRDLLVVDIDATYAHNFTGIGGVRYLPSFPQWDRQQTTYPFAF